VTTALQLVDELDADLVKELGRPQGRVSVEAPFDAV
jgi:hypothetical protein